VFVGVLLCLFWRGGGAPPAPPPRGGGSRGTQKIGVKKNFTQKKKPTKKILAFGRTQSSQGVPPGGPTLEKTLVEMYLVATLDCIVVFGKTDKTVRRRSKKKTAPVNIQRCWQKKRGGRGGNRLANPFAIDAFTTFGGGIGCL